MKIIVFWKSGARTEYEGEKLKVVSPRVGNAHSGGIAIGRTVKITSKLPVKITKSHPHLGSDFTEEIEVNNLSAHIPLFTSEDVIEVDVSDN